MCRPSTQYKRVRYGTVFHLMQTVYLLNAHTVYHIKWLNSFIIKQIKINFKQTVTFVLANKGTKTMLCDKSSRITSKQKMQINTIIDLHLTLTYDHRTNLKRFH